MRITFLLTGYPWKPSGGFRVVYSYANELVRRGHSVTVVHPRRHPPGAVPGEDRLAGRLRGRADRLRNRFLRPPLHWQAMDPRVRMSFAPGLNAEHVPDADAVFATWWSTAERVLSYPRSKGLKCHLIQGYETWGGNPDAVDAAWRAPLRKVVIADWLRDVGRRLGVPGDAMVHIPNGIDHETFRIVHPTAGRPEVVSMLYAEGEWKGANDGLLALELARAERPSMRAIIFGSGRAPRRLPRWAEYVRSPATAELVRNVYNGSSVYLGSSLVEGWYLPGAEAMACGCAVVSTDCLGIRDYAVHKENALLSPPSAPDALAVHLVRILRDPAERARLAAAGHRRISGFTWGRSSEMLESWLIRQLEADHSAASPTPDGAG